VRSDCGITQIVPDSGPWVRGALPKLTVPANTGQEMTLLQKSAAANLLEQGTRSGSPSLHDNSLEINRITSQVAGSLP
jgi:hypothetical protein